ncbi:MAG: SulP family inorganic anion transporter [Burkholderiaceae bacterium]
MKSFSLPILRWAPQWREPGTIRADLLAGLTNAIVVLPQGFAFATIAGMPVQYGLYAAMVPCLVAALFGSSRLMVTGPANAISLTTLALLGPLAEPGSARYVELAITLAFLVGVVQLVLGLVRAGRFVDIVPHSVIVGFTAGAAVLIAVAQLGPFLGIELPRGLSVLSTFESLAARFGEIRMLALASGLITVATIIAWKPWNRKLPAVLVGVIAGSVAAAVLQQLWPQLEAVRVIPPLPAVVPPLSWPDLSLNTLALLPGAVAVMTLLALTEALAIARAVALKSKDAFDDSQEFRAQGLSNIAGSFFSAFPTSGSFNRSGVNIVSGARTPLAAASASVFLVGLLLMVGPLATWLPYCVVAGLLFMVAWGLIDRPEIARIWREDVSGRLPLVATFVATITLSLEWAILIGLLSAWLARRFHRSADSGH